VAEVYSRSQRFLVMILLSKPSAAILNRFLSSQASLSFTYAEVGFSSEAPPSGYFIDRTRVKLGTGESVFMRAQAALCRWDQFRLGWVEAYSTSTLIEPGSAVAVMVNLAGLWWLSACRVIYLIDEVLPIQRFGFAYGTLPDHPASGEERFLVERDPADDVVWYEILAFSRPHGLKSRLGHRSMRRIQKRFGKESAAAMIRAAQAGPEEEK
jgi:uncharacterized protein (UPF0548 family)